MFSREIKTHNATLSILTAIVTGIRAGLLVDVDGVPGKIGVVSGATAGLTQALMYGKKELIIDTKNKKLI